MSQNETYEAVKQKVESEIERHFKFVLNRPEILNRMGENIIVFDFIREDTAAQIFHHMVMNIIADLKSQGLVVSLGSDAMNELQNLCLSDLSNGGRGIRNQVEAHLLNPLARALFDADAAPGSTYLVSSIQSGQLTLESAAI